VLTSGGGFSVVDGSSVGLSLAFSTTDEERSNEGEVVSEASSVTGALGDIVSNASSFGKTVLEAPSLGTIVEESSVVGDTVGVSNVSTSFVVFVLENKVESIVVSVEGLIVFASLSSEVELDDSSVSC